jgi:hypothetical protein
MKIQSLFDLLQDAQDLLSFFDGVTNKNQMISRLETLKRQAPENLFDTIDAMRISTSTALEEHLELGGTISDGESQDNLLDELNTLSEADTSSFEEQKNGEPGLTNPTTEPIQEEKVSS